MEIVFGPTLSLVLLIGWKTDVSQLGIYILENYCFMELARLAILLCIGTKVKELQLL